MRPIMRPIAVLLAASTAALAGCSAAPRPNELMAVDRAWSEECGRKDADAYLARYADDAVLYGPNMAPLVGKDAIRAFVEQAFATPGFSVRWTPQSETFSSAGDVGWTTASIEIVEPNAMGALVTRRGWTVCIWRRTSQDWRCVVDVFGYSE